jgi:hypothetical protein
LVPKITPDAEDRMRDRKRRIEKRLGRCYDAVMKPATFIEGPAAFDRFRDAMKVLVGVPKSAVVDRATKRTQPKKRTKRR